VGRQFVDEQESTKAQKPSPPVTPRLGKRCWGLPIFNEFGEIIHKIYSINALRLGLKAFEFK
jgi:hypothetical protein